MKAGPWPAARVLRAYSLEFQRAFLQNEPNFLTSSQSVGCKIPLVVGVEFHRRERWRTRRTPSKAAKTEAMRIGGAFLRNEPNLLTEIGVPLRSMRRHSATARICS